MDDTTLDSVVTDKEQVAQLDTLLNDPTQLVMKDLNGTEHTFRLEMFSSYKTAQVLKLLASLREKVNLIQLISEIITLEQSPADGDVTAKAQQIQAAFSAIPTMMEFAPDALLDFASIATISNAQLREAYTNGTLEQVRQENRNLFAFDFDGSVPMRVLAEYIPFVGLNFLVQQMRQLNQIALTLIPQTNPNPQSTG